MRSQSNDFVVVLNKMTWFTFKSKGENVITNHSMQNALPSSIGSVCFVLLCLGFCVQYVKIQICTSGCPISFNVFKFFRFVCFASFLCFLRFAHIRICDPDCSVLNASALRLQPKASAWNCVCLTCALLDYVFVCMLLSPKCVHVFCF